MIADLLIHCCYLVFFCVVVAAVTTDLCTDFCTILHADSLILVPYISDLDLPVLHYCSF